MNRFASKKTQGFTLIELLVVVFIISILATLATFFLHQAKSKAIDAKIMSDVKSISSALELYRNDEGDYPADLNTKWGQPLVGPTSRVTYFKKLPNQADSMNQGNYCQGSNAIYTYQYFSNPVSYALRYCLNNSFDGCKPGPKVAVPGLVIDCDAQVSSVVPAPNCVNKFCGSDGAGGSCGSCQAGLKCDDQGSSANCVICLTDADCPVAGQSCQFGSCLPCTANSHCSACNRCDLTNGSPTKNQCLAQSAGQIDASGYCVNSDCHTNVCNANKQCTTLHNFEACSTGFCIADSTCCAPETCASKGYACGSFSSTNCPGVTVNCPSCTGGKSCVNNQCCLADSVATTCGNKCVGTMTNNCGQTIDCATNICSGATPICDAVGTGNCVSCLTNADCDGGVCKKCSSGTCQIDTSRNSGCTGACYDGTCAATGVCNVFTSGKHGCGDCQECKASGVCGSCNGCCKADKTCGNITGSRSIHLIWCSDATTCAAQGGVFYRSAILTDSDDMQLYCNGQNNTWTGVYDNAADMNSLTCSGEFGAEYSQYSTAQASCTGYPGRSVKGIFCQRCQ